MLIADVAIKLESRLLDGLAISDVKVIVAAGKEKHLRPNSVVINQGDPAHHLFLLMKGRARFFFNTREGKKIVLLWLTPGAIFGGSALLSMPCSYLVSTETLEDSALLMWDRPTLRRLMARYPRLLENTCLIAYDYLAWYVADHVALTSRSARERLARVLVCLAESIGEKVADGFEFDATNEELASAANVTRFTASRLLSEWHRIGVISKRRGRIIVRSADRLSRQTD
jgi:CRP-like cAMP-binding protein